MIREPFLVHGWFSGIVEICSSNYKQMSGMYDVLSHLPNLARLTLKVINVTDVTRVLCCPRLVELTLRQSLDGSTL